MTRGRAAATVARLERATGSLARAATTRMEQNLPWFARMGADDRAWVGLVAQAGIAAFVAWYRDPDARQTITADVFGTAPRDLVRAISLAQAVELVRTTIDAVEAHIDELADPADASELREAILRYSREIAFAAAEVYARAAEERGAWDARLESLVLESLLRSDPDDHVGARAAALGWTSSNGTVAVVGSAPDADRAATGEALRRTARAHRLDAITGVHGDALVVVLGGASDPHRAARWVTPHFGPGPVVVGPVVAELADAGTSVAEALSSWRVAPGWPDAPRLVAADALLVERAIAGEHAARDRVVRETAGALASDPVLAETAAAFLERCGSIEATARALFVHPNTVRYRLRRVTDVTGRVVTEPRDALALRLGLVWHRLGYGAHSDTGPVVGNLQ